jgi:hypothetical protein
VFVSVLLVPVSAARAQQSSGTPPQCRPADRIVRIPELTEASGLAASRRVAGRLWAHNDSGAPVLFALDPRGAVTGRFTVPGAEVEDWEAVAVGACPAGACIHVADIGDNKARRRRISIYRIPEPSDNNETPPASEVFHATYPDGPHDAEALLIAPDGRLFIVTKGETGPVALYAFPRELRPGGGVRLERVGHARDPGNAGHADRITDGSVSGDGQWVVLRTTAVLVFYRAADVLAGNWREAGRVELEGLGEPQGEGVAFGPDNVLYLVGEGGGNRQPGTFARVTCGREQSVP